MEIRKKFNSIAEQYDEQRRKLIPCFDDFYNCAVDNFKFETNNPKVLDLGAGTGLLTQKLLEHYPLAEVKMIDLSENMLAIARQRFENKPNVSFRVADYSAMPFADSYDAIISSLSIHHLEDADKAKLYKKIYCHLKPEGIFINAEQVLGEDQFIEEIYRKVWENSVEQSGLAPDEIANAYERVKLDKRTPLSTQLNWLKEVGFNNVSSLYQHYSFAVLYARK